MSLPKEHEDLTRLKYRYVYYRCAGHRVYKPRGTGMFRARYKKVDVLYCNFGLLTICANFKNIFHLVNIGVQAQAQGDASSPKKLDSQVNFPATQAVDSGIVQNADAQATSKKYLFCSLSCILAVRPPKDNNSRADSFSLSFNLLISGSQFQERIQRAAPDKFFRRFFAPMINTKRPILIELQRQMKRACQLQVVCI
ncbi:unnamed protein product [Trichogramma brassicae]|uniref:Uncharacterized protein n=1 Tax=Trichogramma brassicae TaxID=86971 RepID=A0A6H5ITW3_9HYME|nr:unnamed protein product [Trichogramma brassicae]